MPAVELNRDAKVYVAGHNGLAGSAIWSHLESQGFSNLIGKRSAELDLRDRGKVFDFFDETRPDCVILAAARVGGIMANMTHPAEFLSENLLIQTSVLDAAQQHGVEKLLFLGSSCVYPKDAPQPLRESYLLNGDLEPTNDGYAIAKIAGIFQVQTVRRQYGLPWISAMPTNLYGPRDNFSPATSHLVPALIRRYTEATEQGNTSVTNWGTGTARREFMHVNDLAEATLFLLENYEDIEHVNIGRGEDETIAEIANMAADIVGFDGETLWDTEKPDGMRQKLMDISKLRELGWTAKYSLHDGLEDTFRWFQNNRKKLRA